MSLEFIEHLSSNLLVNYTPLTNSKVNFTGSTKVGSIVGAMCGKHIKPVTLELGGAAPFIILEDADIDHAVKNAVFGGFLHSGQICMSTK